ncbi:unnamed protein product [Somion occarium]|uniref:Uncharacterized protein n=1 Tax=Somion occarium TaxID=3059160 RepID=A0ABP1CLM0_9APHY
MQLVTKLSPRCLSSTSLRAGCRSYAIVGTTTFIGKPPKLPANADTPAPPLPTPSGLNKRILSALDGKSPSLPTLIDQYTDHSGTVLDVSLPYESRPSSQRRTKFDASDDSDVIMVAHAVQNGAQHKVTVCSGFALDVAREEEQPSEETLIVTCAHTLEEIRHSPVLTTLPPSPILTTSSSSKSGSLIISGTSESLAFHPVTSVPSALHRADLLLLSTSKSAVSSGIRTLPISPYPAQPGASIRAHFIVDKQPNEEGWRPWIGGTWSKWVKGTVLGYRDFAGREAHPGTYDALTHLLFKPLPTPGSSGGPIIDEESGAVVGVVLGSRMDNSIEGVRGWGVPSETIFEMFSLPGLQLKNKS